MAKLTFSGHISSAIGLNASPNISLSKSGSDACGIINSVIASLYMSTNAYSNTYYVTATLYFSGGSAQSSRNIKFDSGNFSGDDWSFEFDDLTVEQANSISSITLSCSSNGSKIFVKNDQSVTVNYTEPSACGAPLSVSVTSSTSGGNGTLSWSGASGGAANGIIGYDIEYADSSNGSSWGGWQSLASPYSTAGYGSYTVAPHNSAGYYRKFRVRTRGGAGSSYYSGWTESGAFYHAYTPAAPANLRPTEGAYQSLTALSWGAVTCNDAISGYQYQYSTNGGSSWSSLASTTGLTFNIAALFAATATSARWVFRVRAYTNKGVYSAFATSETFYRIAAPTAPTSFVVLPTQYESGNINLSWSGTTDEDNNVTGYELQYSASPDNVAWSAYAALKIVPTSAMSGSTTDAPGMERGTYRKYRIRAVDANGLASAFVESATIYRGYVPSTPANLQPTAGIYETIPAASWGASTSPDGTIAGYDYQYSNDGGSTWSAMGQTTALTLSLTDIFAAMARGSSLIFRVRGRNSVGAVGDWATSGAIRKNRLPANPVVSFDGGRTPVTGGEFATVTKRPFIFIYAAGDDDLQPHTVQARCNGGNWNNIESQTGSFTSVYRPTASGNYEFRVIDALQAASGVIGTIGLTLINFSFTDTIIAGTTPTKAAHINELRLVVNDIRELYGLESYAWDEAVIAGSTSLRKFPDHVEELRAAITAAVNYINTGSGGALLTLPTWIDLSDHKPKAGAINELRNLTSAF